MQYGSGNYEIPRNYTSSPVPRVRPEATGIAEKHRGSGMYTCLNHPRVSTFGKQQESHDMENGPMRHVGVKSPILVDPVYNGGQYSNRSARPVPRVRPEAAEVAEKSKGSMGMLLGNYGKPDPYEYQYSRDENIDPKKGPMRQAGVRSPILVDPVYTKGQYSDRTPRPVPRVKPEAEEIATRSKGTVAKLFVTEEKRYYEYSKPKKGPKDHGSENVKRMRRIQREARERQNQKNTPVKAMWKSSQYDSVESRVKEFMQDPPRAPRPGNQPERPHSAPARSNRAEGGDFKNNEPLKPKQSLTPRQAKKSAPVDFVARNARVARSYEIRRSKSQLAIQDSTQKYNDGLKKYNLDVKGKTPSYLQSRQKQWARNEQDRVRNMPDPTVPEGHTVLPDSERRATLTTLKNISYSRFTESYQPNSDHDAFPLCHDPNRYYYGQAFHSSPIEDNGYIELSDLHSPKAYHGEIENDDLSRNFKYYRKPQEFQQSARQGYNYELSHDHQNGSYTKRSDDVDFYGGEPSASHNFRHKKYFSNPMISIKAKNGSSVYVYAPQNGSNMHETEEIRQFTPHSPSAPMQNLSLDGRTSQDEIYNQETFVNGPYQEFEQDVKKSVSFRQPVVALQRSVTPEWGHEYTPPAYGSQRMPTAYRDAYENKEEVFCLCRTGRTVGTLYLTHHCFVF